MTRLLPDRDARWVAWIEQGGRDEARAVTEIYDAYLPMVLDQITRNSGSSDDGKDVFQESILAFVLMVHDGRFRKDASIKNLLMQIVRNQWLTELRRRGYKQKFQEEAQYLAIEGESPRELELVRRPETRQLLQLMTRLHKGCFAILKMVYWYKWPYVKIASLLGMPSADATKTKKHRCTEEMRSHLAQHPKLSQALKEVMQWD